MSKTNTILLSLIMVCLCLSVGLPGQIGYLNPNLKELPLVISWNGDGIKISATGAYAKTTQFLQVDPSRYLEQTGSNDVRVLPGAGNTPVIVDLSNFFQKAEPTADAGNNVVDGHRPRIELEMPKLTLSNYNEPNSFILDLRGFLAGDGYSQQLFLFRGLDVFFVATDNCANLAANANRVLVNVGHCDVKHVILKGGLLSLDDVDQKIPDLCRKYNERYYSQSDGDAFVCLEDCKEDDPLALQNQNHVRGLVTKYNITDFDDHPISFLDDIILTKKGVGLNLKAKPLKPSKNNRKKKTKKTVYDAYDHYKFFPWYEFINLSFTKYMDENRLLIEDAYNNSYIFNSRVHFSNVELIQFFNELKALISEQVK